MELKGKHAVVTGGGSGIGRALCQRFAADGASVTVADFVASNARATAQGITDGGGHAEAVTCDVRDEQQVKDLVTAAAHTFGPIDLFCSNAGVALLGGVDAPIEAWQLSFDVNIHRAHQDGTHPRPAHAGTGRRLPPADRVGGRVVDAARLGAVRGDEACGRRVRGVPVDHVRRPRIEGVGARAASGPDRDDRPASRGGGVAGVDGMLEPDAVAGVVIEGLEAERFLILPHPQVLEYFRRKADDYDRWLAACAASRAGTTSRTLRQ